MYSKKQRLVNLRKARRLIRNRKKYHQTGSRKSIKADKGRKARKPGYRKSKSGKKYYEARKNRSDIPPGRL